MAVHFTTKRRLLLRDAPRAPRVLSCPLFNSLLCHAFQPRFYPQTPPCRSDRTSFLRGCAVDARGAGGEGAEEGSNYSPRP